MGYLEADIAGASQSLLTIPANISRFQGARFKASDNIWSKVFADNAAIFENSLKGGLIETVATNYLYPSLDVSDASWVKRGSPTITPGAADPFGGTTGFAITVGTAGDNDLYRFVTVPNHTDEYSPGVWIKRVSTSGTLIIANPVAAGRWDVNMALLPDSYIYLTKNHPSVSIFSAWAGSAGDTCGIFFYTGSGTKSFLYGGANLEKALFVSSYIPTTTAAASRSVDVLSYPAMNLGTIEGGVSFEFTPTHASRGTIYLLGSYVDADNYTAILHDSTNFIFRKRIAGVNYDATLAKAFAENSNCRIAVSYGAKGMELSVNGVNCTINSDFTALQLGTSIQIGADGNSASQAVGSFKNIKFYSRQPSFRQLIRMTA